jgi:alkylhydroperoxidase family enzyme
MLPVIHTDDASDEVSALLRDVRATYGTVPPLLRVMASSPALLRGYLAFATAMQDGVLPVELRERIAIAVAAGNACEH